LNTYRLKVFKQTLAKLFGVAVVAAPSALESVHQNLAGNLVSVYFCTHDKNKINRYLKGSKQILSMYQPRIDHYWCMAYSNHRQNGM